MAKVNELKPVGQRLKVYDEEDKVWVMASITHFDDTTNTVTVLCDDGIDFKESLDEINNNREAYRVLR